MKNRRKFNCWVRILIVIILVINLYHIYCLINLNLGAILTIRHEFSENRINNKVLDILNQTITNRALSSRASYLLAKVYLDQWDIETSLSYLQSIKSTIGITGQLNREIKFISSINNPQNLTSINNWKETGVSGNQFLLKYRAYLFLIDSNGIYKKPNLVIPSPIAISDLVVLDGNQLLKDNISSNKKVMFSEEKGNILVIYGKKPIYKFIALDTEGVYKFVLEGLHKSPPPIILDLFIDGVLIGSYEYEKGDNLWEEITLKVPLNSGLHLMNLSFSNDAQVMLENTIVDRNAAISKLRIERSD